MVHQALTLSIVIPTYKREGVLLDTIEYLLDLSLHTPGNCEIIIADQTIRHESATAARL